MSQVNGYREIAQLLSQRVADGSLRPGQKLPPRSQLTEELAVTPVTIQRAIDLLVADGVVRTQERQGTFIVPHPPQFHRFAVLFHGTPKKDENSHWWLREESLQRAAESLHDGETLQMSMYYRMVAHSDHAGRRELLQRLQRRELAGIIFTNSPHQLSETPIMADDGVPRVAIMSSPRHPHVPVVTEVLGAFYERSAEYLAQLGRKRVAVACRVDMDRSLPQPVGAYLADAGLETRPEWVAPLGLPGDAAPSWLRLLLHPDMAERPDALLVTDDNLVEPVVRGLRALNLRLPEDLAVVTLWPFPTREPAPIPMTRLGNDHEAIMRTCVDLLSRQLRGESVPSVTQITPYFEHELYPETV